jgi:hypothetical protein
VSHRQDLRVSGPASNSECFQMFFDNLSKKFCRQYMLSGASNHDSGGLVIAANITLDFLPA